MSNDTGHWRWSANPLWENYSSLCQEAYLATQGHNLFIRNHHLKAALYFGIGSIESFLNETMRREMTSCGATEDEIYNALRKPGFAEKLKKWPARLAKQDVSISTDFKELVTYYQDIRNEITHPKRKDHSLYKELDEIKIEEFPALVAEFIIKVIESRKEIFQYWLLGWNQLGMNGDFTYAFLSNNYEFVKLLRIFGYDIPQDATYDEGWQRANMCTFEHYKDLLAILPKDHCQYETSRFPAMPRFCQKWWDEEHIRTCGKR